MDVIDEEKSSFGEFVDISPSSNGFDGTTATILDDAVAESSEASTENDDDSDDFASRLKQHRKQLMAGDGRPKKQEDFSQKLRKHRDGLITTWEHVEGSTRSIDNKVSESDDNIRDLNSEGAPGNDAVKPQEENEGLTNLLEVEEGGNDSEEDDFGEFSGGAPALGGSEEDPFGMVNMAGATQPQDTITVEKSIGKELCVEAGLSVSPGMNTCLAPDVDFGEPANAAENRGSVCDAAQGELAVDDMLGTSVTPSDPKGDLNNEIDVDVTKLVSESEGLSTTPFNHQNCLPANIHSPGDEFDAVNTTESKVNSSLPRQESDDDDFGDFDAPVIPNEFTERTSSLCLESGEGISVADGYNTSAATSMAMGSSEAQAAEIGKDMQLSQAQSCATNDDVFGEFDLAQSMEEPLTAPSGANVTSGELQGSEPNGINSSKLAGSRSPPPSEVGQETLDLLENRDRVANGNIDDLQVPSENVVPSTINEVVNIRGDGSDQESPAGSQNGFETEPSATLPLGDDDFQVVGVFGEAGDDSANEIRRGQQTEGDVLVEFGSVPSVDHPQDEAVYDDNRVGESGATPSDAPHAERAEENAFGSFESAQSSIKLEEASTEEDEEFGDFGDAAEHPSELLKDNAEEFCGFGSTPYPDKPDRDAAIGNGKFSGFSDKGESSSESPQLVHSNEEDAVAFGSSRSHAQLQAQDEDEFGDFSDAGDQVSGASQLVHPTEEGIGGLGSSASHDQAIHDDDDDGFGDFGAACDQTSESPQLVCPAEEDTAGLGSTSLPDQDQAEDENKFGDFGAAGYNQAGDVPQGKQPLGDDFGDFGSAPLTNSDLHQLETPDDDEFGDFGGAFNDSKIESPTEQPGSTASDDFGDFGSAQTERSKEQATTQVDGSGGTNQTPEPNDDFGDFSSNTMDIPDLASHPQFERAKLVFSKIRLRYAAGVITDVGEEANDNVTLKSFMVRIDFKV